MKAFQLALVALATMMVAGTASATVQEPIWGCNLAFAAKGGGFKVIVGKYELKGKGNITCMDVLGNVETIPVDIKIGTDFSPSVGIGVMKIAGLATGVGYVASPSDLLGTYVIAGAQGALVLGVGVDVALYGKTNKAVTLNGSVQLTSGLGFNVGLDKMVVSRAK